MFTVTNSFAALAFLIATACGAPKTALAMPNAGTYRIQNVGTGYYMDASGSGQNPGNPVIGFSLNQPATPNQEWKLSFSVEPEISLESISSFIASTISSAEGNGTMGLAMFPKIGISLKLEASTDDNYNICADTIPLTCATASSEFGAQISLEPFTGDANQTWSFTPV